MSTAVDLTAEERALLEQLLGKLDPESTGRPSLNNLLSRWQAFVSVVERGYADSIYEYTNDLSIRDRLEVVLSAAPPTLRSKLEGAVSPVDQRFFEATDEAARPLSAAGGDLPAWWHRVPTRRVGELAEDLQVLGYLR